MNTTKIATKYRRDIDGMRAIAVSAVVIYHAFPSYLTGGFIGVDIFFVISGYLISTIILNNLSLNSFSIADFYSRRIKRIFPALLLILSSSLIFGWFFLFSSEYKLFGKQVVGGLGFISNFVLWRESGYFDTEAELKPLLHLWSLAVEEQFYIFWPIYLLVIWRVKKYFIFVTISLMILSFVVCIYLTRVNPTAAFFLPITRFWELAAGGLLAFMHSSINQQGGKQDNIKSVCGVALILLGFFTIDKHSLFPGWLVALPVLGSILLISSSEKSIINRQVLGNKISIFFGKISYPLYLWHWPIFSFARIITDDINAYFYIILIFIAIFLSWLTYEFVEKKIRWKTGTAIIIKLIGVSIILLTVGMTIYIQYGITSRNINETFKNERPNQIDLSRNSDGSCKILTKRSYAKEEVCITTSADPELLFIGDSHAMALYSAIQAGDINIKSTLIAGHSCYLYPHIDFIPNDSKGWSNNCRGIAQMALNYVRDTSSIKTIIISNIFLPENNNMHFVYQGKKITAEEAFIIGNGFMIHELEKMGKNVIYIVDVPAFQYPPSACESRLIFPPRAKNCELGRTIYVKSREFYMNLIEKIKTNSINLDVIDITNLFCDENFCRSKQNKEYMYFDRHHLNLNGSNLVLQKIINKN